MNVESRGCIVFGSVDDETLARLRWIAGVFERTGHRTRVVQDGRDILNPDSEGTPDIIVADIMLPGRDGFDLANALRGAPNRPAIILLGVISAEVGAMVRGTAERLRLFDALIIKPYPANSDPRSFQETLIATIALQLARRGIEPLPDRPGSPISEADGTDPRA